MSLCAFLWFANWTTRLFGFRKMVRPRLDWLTLVTLYENYVAKGTCSGKKQKLARSTHPVNLFVNLGVIIPTLISLNILRNG